MLCLTCSLMFLRYMRLKNISREVLQAHLEPYELSLELKAFLPYLEGCEY